MIVIVDYGMGNLGSIVNMLKKIGAQACISSLAAEIEQADKLILPGVGAFDTGMRRLKELDLIELLNRKVLAQKTPTLGVCLGMQLLTRSSEEGVLPGLGWIPGKTIRFQIDAGQQSLKVPHMGWNTVVLQRPDLLFQEMPDEPRFYFVHSYHIICDQQEDIVAVTEYGYPFTSVIQRDNIWAVQFHPETSHRYGMKLLQNFVELT
jgi:imidazole glycerol-phosphate synthase subunit HisH